MKGSTHSDEYSCRQFARTAKLDYLRKNDCALNKIIVAHHDVRIKIVFIYNVMNDEFCTVPTVRKLCCPKLKNSLVYIYMCKPKYKFIVGLCPCMIVHLRTIIKTLTIFKI